jgi:hypothetical protein
LFYKKLRDFASSCLRVKKNRVQKVREGVENIQPLQEVQYVSKCSRSLHLSGEGLGMGAFLLILHLSLQYFTSSQTFSHFLRQVNGLSQTTQIFSGKCCFFIALLKLK